MKKDSGRREVGENAAPPAATAKASVDGEEESNAVDQMTGNLVIPTMSVCLQYADLIEHSSFRGAVVLGSVLEDLRARSAPHARRLTQAVREAEKRFSMFANQFHSSTFVQRLPGESLMSSQARAVAVSAIWLHKHSPRHSLVILTDSPAEHATISSNISDPSVRVLSVVDFVEEFLAPSNPSLRDIVLRAASNPVGSAQGEGSAIFPAYLDPSELRAGLKSSKFVEGPIRIPRRNAEDGFVPCQSPAHPNVSEILIRGREHLNRTVSGDMVVVEILESVDSESSRMFGKVVGVSRRNWKPYPGSVSVDDSVANSGAGTQSVLFVPVDSTIPKIRIRTQMLQSIVDQRIIVCIDRWDVNSSYPEGHYVRSLGRKGDKNVETEVLLLQHDVPYHNFSTAVLDCLPADDWTVATHATPADWLARKDLRDREVVSVDPPGCTDIDDALHVKFLPDGLVEVGVHIADVSHFVRPETAMDREAGDRGTTVYLVNRRIDMLPKLLGENVCSLVGGGERFAFSVMWIMESSSSKILDVSFCKSVIRSRGAFSYGEAQQRIDDSSRQDSVTKSLRTLLSLSKILKQQRIDAGALELASTEVKFVHEDGNRDLDPVELSLYETKETNSMVEEFMLLANVTVAEKIADSFSNCAMLRRHPPPEPSMFAPLLQSLQRRGVDLDTTSSKALAESLNAASLESASREDSATFNSLIRNLTTRCMQQAVYFSSGSLPRDQYRHYGLAADIYTHFTSPIRRYADVIVHRLLAAAIGADTLPTLTQQSAFTQGVADHINKRNRMAQFAARVSTELHIWLYFGGLLKRAHSSGVKWATYGLEGQEPAEAALICDAFITKILPNGFVAAAQSIGVESAVKLCSSHEELPAGWKVDEANQCITDPTGVTWRMFDRVQVAVVPDDDRQKAGLLCIKPMVNAVRVPLLNKRAATPSQENSSKRGGKKQRRR